jgi:hypothetical protein
MAIAVVRIVLFQVELMMMPMLMQMIRQVRTWFSLDG